METVLKDTLVVLGTRGGLLFLVSDDVFIFKQGMLEG